MRNNSQLFKQIILNLPNYIFWKDIKLVYRGCNYNFARAAGFDSPDQVIGKSDDEMRWAPYTSAIYKAEDRQILETGKSILHKEVPMIMEQGKELFLSVSKVPLYSADQDIIGVLGIYIDITKQKEMEKTLIAEKEKAEAANLLKTDFINNMQHDIRTPISGIWGVTQHLSETESDPNKKELLIDLANCSQELLEYCNDLVDFANIEYNARPVTKKSFDLRKVLETSIAIQAPAAKSKNIELSLAYDHRLLPVVMGDSYRLKRILLNLVSNAIKFTKIGYVKLKVNLEKPPNHQRNLVIRFVVEDSGIGIPEDKKEMIYEKFVRVDPSNRGIYKGSGLGLRVVKQFVEELNGDIYVDSVLNKGTTFIVDLPLTAPLSDSVVDTEKS